MPGRKGPPPRKKPRRSDTFWISGLHTVKEFLNERPDMIDFLVLVGRHHAHRMLIALARENNIPYSRSLERVPSYMRTERKPVVFARLSAIPYAHPEDVIEKIPSNFIGIILDHLQDPQNFGNILRTSAATGVQAVFIPKHRNVRVTPTVAQIASGALAHVRVVRFGSLTNLIQKLQEKGVWIVAADPFGTEYWYQMKEVSGPVCIIVGHEGQGLSQSVLQLCDQTVRLPLEHLDSINVASATAVLLYEIVRQRMLESK